MRMVGLGRVRWEFVSSLYERVPGRGRLGRFLLYVGVLADL